MRRSKITITLIDSAEVLHYSGFSSADVELRSSAIKICPGPRSGKNQSRRTRAGSVRLARHAGNRQAKVAVVAIVAKASPNIAGSYGLTL